ncbi:hypothetical protein [Streptomyces fructofermentans]|uniref:hypothetical protein n=1 Tax=Streptomyces fructofermentans TaxID=152141 RepID=UPI003789EC1F
MPVNPVESSTAWGHPATRRAWAGHVTMNFVSLLGWTGGWIALLGISIGMPEWVVWILVPGFIYGPYRAAIQIYRFGSTIRMLRILRTYPWQVLRDVPHGLTERHEVAGRQYGWFEFLNPARPEMSIALVFGQHFGTGWWSRRMAPRSDARLKSQIATVWFAGDPRFVGLIAAPTRGGTAPRRLHILEQRTAARNGQVFSQWGAMPEDIARGRRVGIRPVHPASRTEANP